ncbi:MAG: hypothetical protein RLZZ15_778 [Verrucomicrobiota bacterium]
MSQIAAALARSKGKKVEPVAPETSVVPPINLSAPPMPKPAAPAAPKQKLTPKLIAIIGGSVVAVALIAWLAWPAPPPPPKPAAKPAPAAPVPAPAPAAKKAPVAAPAPVAVTAAVTPPAPAVPAFADGPMAFELTEQLKKLPISARRAGTDPRIVVGGKVYIPGDAVLEGVFLDAVLPDRVVFRDADGHRYEKRF